MKTHVIKRTHDDGKLLPRPVFWCGINLPYGLFHFLDTHHVALAVGGSIAPCKKCIRAIIRELEKEL